MNLPRHLRSFAALLALFGVLFSQVALAAYACPGVAGMARAQAVADSWEQAAPDCHNLPQSGGIDALCKAHCQQGDQSVERVAAAASVAAMPAGFVVVRVETALCASAPPEAQLSLLERPTEPPASVRHCRFLI